MIASIEKIAATVLYEGYLLWPYRRSARKNQQRWTLGGVYPQRYSALHPDNPWLMQTECLVTGERPVVSVCVRFLQVVARQVMQKGESGAFAAVDALWVGREQYLTWDEATERAVQIDELALPELTAARSIPLFIPAGRREETLTAPDGAEAGALVRWWRTLEGAVEVQATAVAEALWRLTIRIVNTTPWAWLGRAETLRQTFVSTHTILTAAGGEFVSLMDPPAPLYDATAACKNVKTWPVLAGAEGERHVMLSSPMILYDYPQVAPESPGDLFDGGEIDQLLLLNILSLTDAEKAEMRATDPHARTILERCEALTADDFMHLHGAIREFRVLDAQAE
ncbi:MAG: hypothetical protein R3C14_26990 [Caldilineaceae bacterium]